MASTQMHYGKNDDRSVVIPLCFNPDVMESYSKTASVLKALAHEQRLTIASLLAEQSHSVNEIENITGLKQSVVSQHLARLRAANIVRTERKGKNVYYRLSDSRVQKVIDLMFKTTILGGC